MNIWKTLRLANMMAEEGGDDSGNTGGDSGGNGGGGSSMSMGDAAFGSAGDDTNQGGSSDDAGGGNDDNSYSPSDIPEDHWTRTLGQDAKVMFKNESGDEVEIYAKDHPILQKYGSSDEAAKALIHASKKISQGGEGGGEIPAFPTGDEVTEESVADFMTKYREAVGAPGEVDAYKEVVNAESLQEKFKDASGSSLVEMDTEMIDGFTEQAAELGLQPWQAEKLVEWFAPLNAGAITRQAGIIEKTRLDEIHALKAEHNEEAKNIISQAYAGAKAVGGDELLAVLDQTTAGNYKVVMEAFAKIAPHFSEGSSKTPDGSQQGGKLTLNDLRSMQQDDRYTGRGDKPRDPAFVAKVEAGFKALYPNGHDSTQKGPRG
jgi:hypothetical protein